MAQSLSPDDVVAGIDCFIMVVIAGRIPIRRLLDVDRIACRSPRDAAVEGDFGVYVEEAGNMPERKCRCADWADVFADGAAGGLQSRRLAEHNLWNGREREEIE